MNVICWFNVSYFSTVSNHQGVHLLQVKKNGTERKWKTSKEEKKKNSSKVSWKSSIHNLLTTIYSSFELIEYKNVYCLKLILLQSSYCLG